MKRAQGDKLYAVAEEYLLAGAGSAGRIYPLLGRPIYMDRADGAYLHDVDGNKYIDYHNSSGASFLGFNHPAIRTALLKAIEVGFFLGYETEHHAKLGRYICEMVPSAERVRFHTGGLEATMAAIRLARAVTNRKKILKFEGHFHGMHDYVLYNADSLPPMLPNGEVQLAHDSAGMPNEIDSLIVVIPFNNPEIFSDCMRRHKGEFAAIIMEPVVYNAGCIFPKKDFVQLVRDESTRDGAILIFDEVLSGFRMAPGGGQEYLGITPDLTCLSKALGCGMPVAALAGKKEVMQGLTPFGNVSVSGTYTGHLVSIMGALAGLDEIRKPGFYDKIDALAKRLYDGINEIFHRRKIKAVCQGLGARFAVYFGIEPGEAPILDFRKAAMAYDYETNQKFLQLALEKGLYFRDYTRRIIPMHHGFTGVHTMEDIEETLNRLEDVFAAF